MSLPVSSDFCGRFIHVATYFNYHQSHTHFLQWWPPPTCDWFLLHWRINFLQQMWKLRVKTSELSAQALPQQNDTQQNNSPSSYPDLHSRMISWCVRFAPSLNTMMSKISKSFWSGPLSSTKESFTIWKKINPSHWRLIPQDSSMAKKKTISEYSKHLNESERVTVKYLSSGWKIQLAVRNTETGDEEMIWL